MAAPKHLWSGGWEHESARRREELARNRGDSPERPATEIVPDRAPVADEAPTIPRVPHAGTAPRTEPPPTIPRLPPARPRRRATPRREPRRTSLALILAAIALLAVAGGAYAALSSGGSTGTPAALSQPGATSRPPGATSPPPGATTPPPGATSPPPVSGAAPWLGVQLESLPMGGMVIATVDPGSPAEQAGLEPGDVITEINNQPINGPADLRAAIGGLHAGEAIEIQVNRGSTSYTTHATLATRPTSFP